jgi:hypothetical protein
MVDMRRIRHFVSTVKIAPAGWILVVVVPVCALLVFIGPKGVQTAAFLVGAFALAMVVIEALGMPRFGGRGFGRQNVRERREFAQRTARAAPKSSQAPVEAGEDAWRRERERREHRDLGGGF